MIDPDELPVLVDVTVAEQNFLDAVTDDGLADLGLPVTYPRDAAGAAIPWAPCQAIGQAAHTAGAPGVAARSAAPGAWPDGEELAVFLDLAASAPVRHGEQRVFADWYGSIDW